MIVPTIRPTDCPRVEELLESFSIVHTARFPGPSGSISIGFLGRAMRRDDGAIWITDAFDYQCMPEIVRSGGGAVGLLHRRSIKPVDGCNVYELTISGSAVIIPLRQIAPRIVEEIRHELVSAWESRQHLTKAGARVALATSVEGVRRP